MPFQSDCAFAAPGLLRGFVMLEGQPDRHWHVGLYANGRFLGATLADGGVNPVTGEQVIDAGRCRQVLAEGPIDAVDELDQAQRGEAEFHQCRVGVESFAAGPFDGRVLVGTDDGRRSELSLIDVAGGCVRSISSI